MLDVNTKVGTGCSTGGVVPLQKPSVSPATDEQQEVFDELDDIMADRSLSSVCGWAIKQRGALEN